jgi:TolA-binding protein
MLEMTTGQKIPQMSGSIGEIQTGLQNIQLTLGQVIQQQQSLEQRLTAIENNAVQSFNNLTNQVQSIRSIRLTHDRESKRIEYNNSNGQLNTNKPNYNN